MVYCRSPSWRVNLWVCVCAKEWKNGHGQDGFCLGKRTRDPGEGTIYWTRSMSECEDRVCRNVNLYKSMRKEVCFLERSWETFGLMVIPYDGNRRETGKTSDGSVTKNWDRRTIPVDPSKFFRIKDLTWCLVNLVVPLHPYPKSEIFLYIDSDSWWWDFGPTMGTMVILTRTT